MSKDNQNKDIHWFLVYAIVDEIIDATLPTDASRKSFDQLKPQDCLPNMEDKEKLNDIMAILWSRIIVKTIPEFQKTLIPLGEPGKVLLLLVFYRDQVH